MLYLLTNTVNEVGYMKKIKWITGMALATTVVAGVTICLLKKHRQKKRSEFVSNAGYEMAYDVNFPVKYKR
jgi:hypothetical protein